MNKKFHLKWKLIISLLLVVSFLVTTSTSVFAIKIPEDNHYLEQTPLAGYYLDSEVATHLLSRVGLFKDSSNIFGLDKKPTKLDGLIMYIKLLGKEKEALKMQDKPCAFTGVPDDAKGYVNYAYKYKKELLYGLDEEMYSSTKELDQNTFFTLLLRALGYDDRAGDFSRDNARSKAYEIRLINDSTYSAFIDGFEKDSMAVVCYFALLTKIKGTEKTLADKLVSLEAINKFKAVHAGVFMGDEETSEFGLVLEASPYVKYGFVGRYIDSEIAALLLSELGIYENCSSVFELDDAPTKLEGLIMYIKLLGKEKEALMMTNESCAFKNIPDEAKGYVNYANKYKDEILYGLGEEMFSSSQKLDENTFFTLLLRALGYDDRKGDFSLDNLRGKAFSAGIITDCMYGSVVDGLEKNSMAQACYFTLLAHKKGTDKTLAEELISKGVIDSFTAVQIGIYNGEATKDISGEIIYAEPTNFIESTPLVGDYIDSEMAALLLSRIGFFEYCGSKFGLENFPTKLEGLIMYIKLLGKEKEALKMKDEPCAFKGVPDETKGYVNYAYKYKKELLYGLDEDMYSPFKLLDKNTFFTLLLRSLGYDDRAGDFSADNAWSKAYEIGLISDSTYSGFVDGFEKDSMAVVCYFALITEMKGTDKSLGEVLVSKGVLDRKIAEEIRVIESPEE